MLTTVGQETCVLNFVVVGEIRSGTSLVQTTLSSRPDAVCHGDLFHPDLAVRRREHESYFGPSPAGAPQWFDGENISPWQYINQHVLDRPRRKERSVGLRLLYPIVRHWELFELFHERCQEGDFCLVHVLRNPLACFISLKQAEQSGVWRERFTDPVAPCPSPASLEIPDLVDFCRKHLALRQRIRTSCDDVLEISYRDLHMNYTTSMKRVYEFLELPIVGRVGLPGYRRLRNRTLPERVYNWSALKREVPSDIRGLFEDEDLF